MTSYHNLVGLLGRARSGKDTFARGLANQGYARVAFADPLRDALAETDPFVAAIGPRPGVPRRLSAVLAAYGGWEGAKDSPHAEDIRGLLQRYGQTIRRLDEDFWLRQGLAKATRLGQAVITDVRYRNEADAILAHGGALVRVVRPGLDTSDTHASETELDDYPVDTTVHNRSTAEALEALGASIEL